VGYFFSSHLKQECVHYKCINTGFCSSASQLRPIELELTRIIDLLARFEYVERNVFKQVNDCVNYMVFYSQ